jgi:hypothetical protein
MSVQSRGSFLVSALAVAGALLASPARAQMAPPPADVHAALVKDVATLSDKFTGLARVMAGKYDWRPGQGVRSVSEVFNLIVTENKMLAGLLSGTAGQGRGGGMGRGAAITDPAALQDALRSSYESVSQALSGLSAADMNASVTLFGQQTTKQGAVLMLLLDQHEHLGQSIAYARTNGVVPPWSK